MDLRFKLMTLGAKIYQTLVPHDHPPSWYPLEDASPALDGLVRDWLAGVLAERGAAPKPPHRIELQFFVREKGAIELMATFRFDDDSQWRAKMVARSEVPESVAKTLPTGIDSGARCFIWSEPT